MADYKGKYTGAELDNILSVIKLDGVGGIRYWRITASM